VSLKANYMSSFFLGVNLYSKDEPIKIIQLTTSAIIGTWHLSEI